jgi:hypothetical protein
MAHPAHVPAPPARGPAAPATAATAAVPPPPSGPVFDPALCTRILKQWKAEDPHAAHEGGAVDVGAEAGDDVGMCLSMHQPWASLLVLGIKRVEVCAFNPPKFLDFLFPSAPRGFFSSVSFSRTHSLVLGENSLVFWRVICLFTHVILFLPGAFLAVELPRPVMDPQRGP